MGRRAGGSERGAALTAALGFGAAGGGGVGRLVGLGGGPLLSSNASLPLLPFPLDVEAAGGWPETITDFPLIEGRAAGREGASSTSKSNGVASDIRTLSSRWLYEPLGGVGGEGEESVIPEVGESSNGLRSRVLDEAARSYLRSTMESSFSSVNVYRQEYSVSQEERAAELDWLSGAYPGCFVVD